MKRSQSIPVFSRLAARGSRLNAYAAILILCFAYAANSQAQSVSQKAPTVTFQVYQAKSAASQEASTGDKTLGTDGTQGCCNISSTLTDIPPCGQPLLIAGGKSGGPLAAQDSCCCVDLDVFYDQGNPDQQCITPVCGVDVIFQNGAFDPLCNVCALPPGWTYYLDDPYIGKIHLRYSGSDCSGVLQTYGQHLHFQFCGQNASGYVCYNLAVYQCTTDPKTGKCVASSTPFCTPEFCNNLSCDAGSYGVTNTNHFGLTVDAGYPNPATSSIRFGFSAKQFGTMVMTLVDLLGNTVSTSNSRISAGEGNITINLPNAQPGVYYCVFELNGERITRRIQVK